MRIRFPRGANSPRRRGRERRPCAAAASGHITGSERRMCYRKGTSTVASRALPPGSLTVCVLHAARASSRAAPRRTIATSVTMRARGKSPRWKGTDRVGAGTGQARSRACRAQGGDGWIGQSARQLGRRTPEFHAKKAVVARNARMTNTMFLDAGPDSRTSIGARSPPRQGRRQRKCRH